MLLLPADAAVGEDDKMTGYGSVAMAMTVVTTRRRRDANGDDDNTGGGPVWSFLLLLLCHDQRGSSDWPCKRSQC